MKITGELLKSERINKGLSLQNIANSLKLSVKIIAAIEAGDFESLPSKTFVRGFVKSYAEFLKLDSAAVLRQFQEEMGSTIPLPKVPPPMPVPTDNITASKPTPRQTSQNYSQVVAAKSASAKQQHLKEDKVNQKILMSLLGAVVLVFILVAGSKFLNMTNSEEGRTPPVTRNSTDVIIPNYDNIEPSATASSDSTVTSNPTDSATSTAVNNSTTAVTNQPVVAVTSATTKVTEPVNNTVNDEVLVASSGKPVELILEAKKEIEVFYAKGNTKNFKSFIITPDRLQILRSATGLHIKAADGGAFRITANGVDIGQAGPNNKPVKLSF